MTPGCSALEFISPNIAHRYISTHSDLLAMVDDKLQESTAEVSGVISDGSVQGQLIEKNSLKNGRMVFLPTDPTDPRVKDLYRFILASCGQYLATSQVARYRNISIENIEMERCWIIDQRENDYQVLHAHIPNVLSGIIYLEVPDSMGIETYPDGILTLIETNPFVVLPGTGDMYIWPAYMLHHVYPFQGPGRRVAISFNVKDRQRGYDADVYFSPNYVQVSKEEYFGQPAAIAK